MGSLTPTIRAEGLEYLYEATARGVRGLDLRVDPGEIVAVLGPNGSGKSTLLRLLDTELRPRAGRLELFGVDPLARLPETRRQIGVVFDRAAHLDELTGERNAVFLARAYGVSRDGARRQVEELLRRFGLWDHRSERVGTYSFGMRRRLSIVSCLAHRPSLLVMDEPTVGLDIEGRTSVQQAVAERAREGAAVLLATNDLAGVAESVDRVVFLLDGRIVADAPPDRLIAEIDASTVIEVSVGPHPLPWPGLRGVELVERGPTLRFESRRGADALPDLIRTLLECGAQMDSVAIREPGLAEAFRTLTGRTLNTGESGAHPPGRPGRP